MSTNMQKAKGVLAGHIMDAVGGDNKTAADVADRFFEKIYPFTKSADDGMANSATAETIFAMPEGPGKPPVGTGTR